MSYFFIVDEHSFVTKDGGRLHTTVACTRLFSWAVRWNKLEKADAQISISLVVFFVQWFCSGAINLCFC